MKLKILSEDECVDSHNSYVYNETIKYAYNETIKNHTRTHTFITTSGFRRTYHMCVESSSEGTCHGDSGGPLICNGLSPLGWEGFKLNKTKSSLKSQI